MRGASAPDPLGTIAMAVAGIAWGAYSLRGRSSTAAPLPTTAANFAMTLPLIALVLGAAAVHGDVQASPRGVALAVASGALASGVGYSLWYAALKHLTAIRAGILQLAVPILAAFGGVVALDESISSRLVIAGVAIIGGVAVAITRRVRAPS
jgi:drug/metabolite transporter (DMT)-like permease